MAAHQGLQRLTAYLPGGTYLTFTVIAQIAAETNALMSSQVLGERCAYGGELRPEHMDCCHTNNIISGEFCGSQTRFALTICIVVVTAAVCFVMALFGASIDDAEVADQRAEVRALTKVAASRLPTQASAEAIAALAEMTDDQIVETLELAASRFRFFDYAHAAGSTVIFLVLALLTPPVSMCFFGPCLPSVVGQTIPLVFAFGGSALLAVWKAAMKRAKTAQQHRQTTAAAAAAAMAQWRERRQVTMRLAPALTVLSEAAEAPPPSGAGGAPAERRVSWAGGGKGARGAADDFTGAAMVLGRVYRQEDAANGCGGGGCGTDQQGGAAAAPGGPGSGAGAGGGGGAGDAQV